jgi:hypothetical protein
MTYLAAAGASVALLGAPSRASDSNRAGFDDLSREMSTCAAYFSLLSDIVENSPGPEAKAETAQRIKSTGQAMLIQSINVANYIGLSDDVVMKRVQTALKEMVETVNGDPANSLQVMHVRYGQPCDELLESAAKRFADLLELPREDF